MTKMPDIWLLGLYEYPGAETYYDVTVFVGKKPTPWQCLRKSVEYMQWSYGLDKEEVRECYPKNGKVDGHFYCLRSCYEVVL